MVNNIYSGPNNLIAQLSDWFCPGNIGYSSPLIADYKGFMVTITSPTDGSTLTTADDIEGVPANGSVKERISSGQR